MSLKNKASSLMEEFKAFAFKGNIVDMAIGVIIGGAFGKIVTSLVNDIIMPPIGLLIGGVDFTNLKLVIKKAVVEGGAEIAPAVTWNYGAFIQQVVDFTILAFCVFMMVKVMNKLLKKEEAKPAPAPAPPAPSKEEVLLTEIRDILKNK